MNNEVDQAANDAKNAISSATTEKAVKTAQTDGVDKINAIDVATTAAKDKAKSDIDQTANVRSTTCRRRMRLVMRR